MPQLIPFYFIHISVTALTLLGTALYISGGYSLPGYIRQLYIRDTLISTVLGRAVFSSSCDIATKSSLVTKESISNTGSSKRMYSTKSRSKRHNYNTVAVKSNTEGAI